MRFESYLERWSEGARPDWSSVDRKASKVYAPSIYGLLPNFTAVCNLQSDECVHAYVRACVRMRVSSAPAQREKRDACTKQEKVPHGTAGAIASFCSGQIAGQPGKQAWKSRNRRNGWVDGWMEIHGVFLIECTQESPSESRGPRTQQYNKVRIHVSLRRRLTGYHVHVRR